jgi:hypothetical protein
MYGVCLVGDAPCELSGNPARLDAWVRNMLHICMYADNYRNANANFANLMHLGFCMNFDGIGKAGSAQRLKGDVVRKRGFLGFIAV